MNAETDLEIFLATVPGLEAVLRAEVAEKGFRKPTVTKGGVTIKGGWREVWRANLELRGASRVLVRLGSFKAVYLNELEKLARDFPWGKTLQREMPVRVEASCSKSRIYHSDAAAERIGKAITASLGAPVDPEADICIKARIVSDICTLSVDTSGEALHKRGHKEAVSKAPMRETLAALMLRHAGFNGKMPLVDPMCGSGTFVIEAAEIAMNLAPGRDRAFAFEQLQTFDAGAWEALKKGQFQRETTFRFHGFDRDEGAIRRSIANADRAGVAAITSFTHQPISDLTPPEGPAGLVFINPPYGVRLGEEKKLLPLYQTLGRVVSERFGGWRVGIVTGSDKLARATGLPFAGEPLAFSHGGIPVKLFTAAPLPLSNDG